MYITNRPSGFFQSEAGQAMVKRVPQRRIGAPADLDGALLLLASGAPRSGDGQRPGRVQFGASIAARFVFPTLPASFTPASGSWICRVWIRRFGVSNSSSPSRKKGRFSG